MLGIDLRGHGGSYTENETDLSCDTLTCDIESVLSSFFASHPGGVPPLLLAGHSLGGILAVRLVERGNLPVRGVCVVDAGEESATRSMHFVKEYINSIPPKFYLLEEAIHWSYVYNFFIYIYLIISFLMHLHIEFVLVLFLLTLVLHPPLRLPQPFVTSPPIFLKP